MFSEPPAAVKVYLFLGGIFVLSFVGAWVLPIDALFKGIFATPAVLALISALFQLMRDHAAHERSLELQQKQQIFTLGATSHMANRAFDKHSEFCERYMKEVHNTVTTLFRDGPTQKALEHARELVNLRQEFAAWLTEDIGKNLFPFEQALRDLGATHGFVQSTSGAAGYEQQRSRAVEKVWQEFNKVLTLQGEKPDDQAAVESVLKRIREILDIEKLLNLRKGLIREASAALEKA